MPGSQSDSDAGCCSDSQHKHLRQTTDGPHQTPSNVQESAATHLHLAFVPRRFVSIRVHSWFKNAAVRPEFIPADCRPWLACPLSDSLCGFASDQQPAGLLCGRAVTDMAHETDTKKQPGTLRLSVAIRENSWRKNVRGMPRRVPSPGTPAPFSQTTAQSVSHGL